MLSSNDFVTEKTPKKIWDLMFLAEPVRFFFLKLEHMILNPLCGAVVGLRRPNRSSPGAGVLQRALQAAHWTFGDFAVRSPLATRLRPSCATRRALRGVARRARRGVGGRSHRGRAGSAIGGDLPSVISQHVPGARSRSNGPRGARNQRQGLVPP